MSKLKILFIVGSLREGSFNKKLAHVTESIVRDKHETTFLPQAEFMMPLMDQDIEKENMPLVDKLTEKLNSFDGIIITSPEYNGSISSPLKNFIDWSSRAKTPAWTLKPVLLLAASPGGLGGVRGLAHTRFPLVTLGAHVYPEMFGLAKAHEAFNEKNELIDGKVKEKVADLATRFLTFVSQVTAST